MSKIEPHAYLVFRIVFGLLFLFHGPQKLFGLYGSNPADLTSLRGVAAVIELICGTLIILGVGTRAAAFLASGLMAVAYFMVHQPQGFWPIQNRGELAVLYCFAFLYIAARGSGIGSAEFLRRAKINSGAVVLLFVLSWAQTATAQQLTPKVKLGEATFDMHGWAHSIYDHATSTTGESVRFRARLTQPRGFGAFVDLDLVNLTKQGGIKRLVVTYNVSPAWQLLVGRFPVAPFYFAPSDIALETIQYARTPFSFYASGVQTTYRSKEGWALVADVTGNSSKRVYDTSQFDRAELSARLSLPVGRATLTETVQISRDFARFGLDVAHAPAKKFRYRTMGYLGRTNGITTVGGYAMEAHQLLSWLEQHNQIDLRRQSQGFDPIIINGIRLKTKPEWVLLTVEHQYYPQRIRKKGFLVRAQIHF